MIEILKNATIIYIDGVKERFDAICMTDKRILTGRILKINGKVAGTKVITLKSGETQKVDFTVASNEPGSYLVEIGDFSGEFQLSGEFQSSLWINWLLILGLCAGLGLLGLLVRYLQKRLSR